MNEQLDHNGFNKIAWNKELRALLPSDKPELVVLAGGSGVGKTILTKVLKGTGAFDEKAYVISPERVIEFAPKLGQGKLLNRHPEEEPQNAELFYKLRKRMVMDCLNHGISVIIDDHCSRLDKMQELMSELEKHNNRAKSHPRAYSTIETAMLGLFLPKEKYLERLSGKGVGVQDGSADHEFAMHANQAFAQNFPELVKLFDTSVLLENNDQEIKIAAKYTMDAGKVKEIEKDEERYDQFQRYSRETLPAPTYAWAGNRQQTLAAGDEKTIAGTGKHSFSQRLDPTGKNWKETAESILAKVRKDRER